jgi:type IV pilus assembly protein PilV
MTPAAFRPRASQRGSFMLEALISILIVALGVLGSVGLLARSMQDIDDAKFRGEAAYLASGYLGQMWVADRTTATLDTNFSSALAGANYTEFANVVSQRLPNAAACPPVVVVGAGPIGATATNSQVSITVYWFKTNDLTRTLPACPSPPDPLNPPDPLWHKFEMTGMIGANQ